jgi:hypothetical protein
VLLHHALQLDFKVRLAIKDVLFITKLDESSLFVNVDLIGVEIILKDAASAQVFVHLDQVKKLGESLTWQLDYEDVSIKESFSWFQLT